MRITIVGESLRSGGAEGQIASSSVALMALGHCVEVLTYYPGNDYQEFLDAHGVRHVLVDQHDPFRLKRVFGLVREIKRFAPDVVHGFGVVPGRYAQLAGRHARARCIFSGCRDTKLHSRHSRLSGWWLTRGRSPGWITNSNAVKEATMLNFWMPSEKVYVVPNGIPAYRVESELTIAEARKQWDLPVEAPIVSMVANLRAEKNHAMALRVAQKVLEQHPNASFLLAGEGPEREHIERMITESGLTDRVKLFGRCAQVGDLFRATDVAILTSLREGLPNTLIEASCAGVPCVSTDNGGASDVIVDGETGYLVPVNDVDAMSGRILELLDDRARRDRMGKSAAEYARNKFSPEALGRNLVAVYERGLEMVRTRR